MLKSYWLLIVAVAGLMLGAAAPIPSIPQNPKTEVEKIQGRVPNEKAAVIKSQPQAKAPEDNRPIVVYVREPERSKGDADAQRQDREQRTQTDRWMVNLTLLIALATVVQAIILAITIGTSLKQLRPYISAIPDYIYSFDGNTLACARVAMKNRGCTPAFDLRARGDVIVLKMPVPESFIFPAIAKEWSPPSALFPDGDLESRFAASRLFSEEELANLEAGTHGLFVFGEVTYRRFRFFRHKTRYARMVATSDSDMRSLVRNTGRTFDVQFLTVAQHNDAS